MMKKILSGCLVSAVGLLAACGAPTPEAEESAPLTVSSVTATGAGQLPTCDGIVRLNDRVTMSSVGDSADRVTVILDGKAACEDSLQSVAVAKLMAGFSAGTFDPNGNASSDPMPATNRAKTASDPMPATGGYAGNSNAGSDPMPAKRN